MKPVVKKAYFIHVKGLVQGVGFRPFVYSLASKLELKGWVENRTDGVRIKVEGTDDKIKEFITLLKNESPPVSEIENIFSKETTPENFIDFRILISKDSPEEITEVSPDIAVCNDCLKDIRIQPHRINYPFANCTNCGPRFTIIRSLPYDRDKTTMDKFKMCEICFSEYTNISDRRFHAQPVACNQCGPKYQLIYNTRIYNDFYTIIEMVSAMIAEGKIVATKGLGGFHLACDALNEEAVSRMRSLKNRETKPFAVMFAGIDKLEKFVVVNDIEKQVLTSWRKPIVILKTKLPLAQSVNEGLDSIGAMLPYMPLHYLLFEKLKTPVIVLTSGNLSEEPVIIKNSEAKTRLSKIYDALLVYNREIYNRTDDSVVFVANGKERLIRRSRGYVPSSVRLSFDAEGILAAGAELKNCFCIGKGNKAIVSQHIGDIKNPETYNFYTESIGRFKRLFRFKTGLVACDMHPGYLSTQYAEESGLKVIKVQHHHAHIASCMAENQLDEKVIGVSFDGTGYGDDGNIWGGEFFVCDLNDYERITHFEYVPMPGGDKATEEPWRMAVSYLYKIYGRKLTGLKLPFMTDIQPDRLDLVLESIEKQINCPLTSSAGRLFDTVAALTSICTISKYEAEAPMRLESLIEINVNEKYNYELKGTICMSETIRQVILDMKAETPVSLISSKFHNTIVSVIFEVAKNMAVKNKIDKIVLSGGIFQNRYILEETEKKFHKTNFHVYSQHKLPSNDGGIALGQLAVAAKRRQLICV